jgi:hypothetical protein
LPGRCRRRGCQLPSLPAAFARWEGDGIGEGWRRSPDIANLVQESIDRPGWESGNAFALLMQPAGGRFRLRGWDYGEGEYAARLHAEYSLAATPTPTATPTPEVREVTIEYEYPDNYIRGERRPTQPPDRGGLFKRRILPLQLRRGGECRLAPLAARTAGWWRWTPLHTHGRPTGSCSTTASAHTPTITAVVFRRSSLVSRYSPSPTLLKTCRANGNGLGDRLLQSLNGEAVQYTLDLNTGLTQVLADNANTYLYGMSRIGQQGPDG